MSELQPVAGDHAVDERQLDLFPRSAGQGDDPVLDPAAGCEPAGPETNTVLAVTTVLRSVKTAVGDTAANGERESACRAARRCCR